MACSISIDIASLIATTQSNGEIIRIDVGGTASDCPQVHVELFDVSTNTTGGGIVVPVTNGAWSAAFIHNENGRSLKDFHCGDKVRIIATCTQDDKCRAEAEDPLPCTVGGPACPDIAITADIGQCRLNDTVRRVTFTVSVSGGQSITYRWFFGDGTPQTPSQTGSGTFQTQHDYAPGGSYSATLIVIDPPGCLAVPDPVTIDVPACGGCPDDPILGVYRRLGGGRLEPVDPDAECVEPGNYTVRVDNDLPAGSTVFWEVNDAPSGQGGSINIVIGAGGATEVAAIVTKDGCSPRSETIILVPCVECPTEAELIVERILPDGRRERIDPDDDCLPAGNYRIRLITQDGAIDIDWFVDQAFQPGESGTSLQLLLEEGQTRDISAIVTYPACPPLNPGVTLRACQCVTDIGLEVRDTSGNLVDPTQCVAPGTYTATATGTGIDSPDTELSWSVNGTDVPGNGTEQSVSVTSPVRTACGASAPVTSIGVRAATPGCRRSSASVALTVCSRFVMSICCEVMDIIVLVLAGCAAIALALALCPQVLVIPVVVAFFVSYGWWIFAGFAALLALALLVWLLLCPPDWCFDVMPMLWQIFFIFGVVLIYFGSCPACFISPVGPLLLWGVGFLLVGAGILLAWIMSCRPTQCQVLWELLKLGLANTLVGLIATAISLVPLISGLALCVSVGAIIFLWLFNLALDFILVLLPGACNFNPRAGGAMAAIRRAATRAGG